MFFKKLCTGWCWINGGSGWILELIESQYIKISPYRPLSGSSYIKLLAELKSRN